MEEGAGCHLRNPQGAGPRLAQYRREHPAESPDGRRSTVIGESAITASPHKIVKLMTEPENPKASQRAVDAIMHADAIILGPGSLYTSVLASLIVPGIKKP